MKKIVLFITLALVLSPLNSCKKDEEPDPPTKTELLTDSVWIGVTVQEYINDELDYTSDFSYLQLNFKIDNSLVITDTEDNDIYTTAWSLTNNETQIIFDDETFTIETLTEASFVFSIEDIYDGDVYKYVYTLKH